MNLYLSRYSYPKEYLANDPTPENLGMVITIPCHAETHLITTLQSLEKCIYPGVGIEIIVVINHGLNSSESIRQFNEQTFVNANQWARNANKNWLKFHIIKAFDLPTRNSGVGLARKIAMDEAVRRFLQVGNSKGIISCLDADCLCDSNYLIAIKDHFYANPDSIGASVYFEHPLEGMLEPEIYMGIASYELHLRYMVHSLKYIDYPYAYHTIGSCMAIRNDIYQKQGGMNSRKAGEDFYFLQKIFPLGNYSEINTTRVIPSPRVSDKVPFGTGKAMSDWIKMENKKYMTYNPLIYNDLKEFIKIINLSYETGHIRGLSDHQLPESIMHFFKHDDLPELINQYSRSSRSRKIFIYKIFNWFNGLKLIKFLNYSRKHFYSDIDVLSASIRMLENRFNYSIPHPSNVKEALMIYRKIDKSGTF